MKKPRAPRKPKATELDPAKAADCLRAAAADVLAEMAFMDAEPAPARSGPGPAGLKIALDALKPLSCRFEFECPQELADRVADILYGTDDGFGNGGGAGADRKDDDSLLEMLNVMAGAFLSAYFGAGTPFKLELPFFDYGASDVTGPEIARVDLDVEGLPVSFTLRSVRYRY